MMFEILPERPGDLAQIEALCDQGFGPGRRRRTVYRLRQEVRPVLELSRVCRLGDQVIASLRLWPVVVGNGRAPGLLLGPLTVMEDFRGQGLGKRLVATSLEAARRGGHAIALIVGPESYYRHAGFRRSLAAGLSLPGPVDADRFLAAELVAGALSGISGGVGRWNETDRRAENAA